MAEAQRPRNPWPVRRASCTSAFGSSLDDRLTAKQVLHAFDAPALQASAHARADAEAGRLGGVAGVVPARVVSALTRVGHLRHLALLTPGRDAEVDTVVVQDRPSGRLGE